MVWKEILWGLKLRKYFCKKIVDLKLNSSTKLNLEKNPFDVQKGARAPSLILVDYFFNAEQLLE